MRIIKLEVLYYFKLILLVGSSASASNYSNIIQERVQRQIWTLDLKLSIWPVVAESERSLGQCARAQGGKNNYSSALFWSFVA